MHPGIQKQTAGQKETSSFPVQAPKGLCREAKQDERQRAVALKTSPGMLRAPGQACLTRTVPKSCSPLWGGGEQQHTASPHSSSKLILPDPFLWAAWPAPSMSIASYLQRIPSPRQRAWGRQETLTSSHEDVGQVPSSPRSFSK